MVFCCAFGCNSRSSQQLRFTEGTTFHKFPDPSKELDRYKKWLVNIRREGFIPSQSARLCSKHFKQEMFDRSGQTTRLKPHAVPTLFAFPTHLQKVAEQPSWQESDAMKYK